ncbi:vacuolar protein sorting-associated protein 41 homolog [Diabrotica virgifera virgifera]|uniref:RING-type domain-containing protein n=1 Tax=Diabrotica virgifera virgifera TaxID=50390 RepID=A0ABM5JXJ4_DIAVI|nr:vacuolar protein sorting-associated protein 41 homolog [Diabrotica virgifera virgifera]XP_050502656.1 vacuolar protein sorting-associated protein 41 homolog [Diabrotica virgifera virgifera]
MSDINLNNYNSDTESSEDEIEPKLKYVRLSNDVQNILLASSATYIAVHPKFICLGSHWGVIHILDHQGNSIQGKELKAHTVSVNQISIDSNGEFVATCSDDGKVFIHSLFSKENDVQLNLGRLLKTVSLDPLYFKFGINKRFITGDDKLTLYERTFLGNLKSTVLCESEGLVRSLCWGENFLAWSSNIGVRVYDMNARCSLGLIKWEDHPGISIDKFRCNLRWADSRTLLIGWVDTVRVCVIRKRSNIELANRDLPEYLVDPVSTFQTEFYISGIAPLDQQLVLLGFPKELDEHQKSLRPQLYIVEYRDNDYTDICTDSLSLRGYEEYSANDYHLDVLLEENRFFIVAPKDVVVASPYDLDDRIQWFIQHNKFDEALDILMQNSRNIYRHTVQSVGIDYLDHLLSRGMYDNAGRLGLRIFGKNPALWEDQIYKFASVHQLRSVSPYIPRSVESKLNPHIYEMILYEYLKLDAHGFLNLVKEWDSGLYNIAAVINAVLEHLLNCEIDKNLYLEALAILYSYEKKYDKSLSMYLKLKHKDVFVLIQKHNLYSVIQDMLLDLMDLDHKKTIDLLLQKNTISSDKIVEKLKENPLHLYRYLDEYDKKNPKGRYHKELVQLYAVFAKDKLLAFLKKSDHYPIQEALDICQKEKYYPEMVYLLGRIGDTKEALALIVDELKDMQHAVAFCQEHDDSDLWEDLIDRCVTEPEFVTFLLQSIGSYVDPTMLILKIKKDTQIPGLKNSLVKMLNQYNLQVSVQEGCKKILVSDYFNLQKKLVNVHQRGLAVMEDLVCACCTRKIVERDPSRAVDIAVYNCKHTFHLQCIPENMTKCGICYTTEQK